MRNAIKTVVFLFVCAAIGFGGARIFMIWFKGDHKRGFEHSEPPPVVTGIGEAPGNRGFSFSSGDLVLLGQLIGKWQSLNATSVGLEYAPGMDRAALVAAAKIIHEHGMSVVLLPPGAQAGTAWSDRDPYPRSLAEIGADAEAAGIETVCVSWLHHPPDPDYWRTQTDAMRLEYSGKLILAADADTLQRVACPEVAEIMGAIGPIEIPRRLPGAPANVSVSDLRAAWNATLTQLESFAKKYDKKLALLHMNVPLAVSARLPNPAAAPDPPPNDPALQSMLYEALLLETKGRFQTTQFLLFDWGTGTRGEGDAPNEASGVTGKLAACWAPVPRKSASGPSAPSTGR